MPYTMEYNICSDYCGIQTPVALSEPLVPVVRSTMRSYIRSHRYLQSVKPAVKLSFLKQENCFIYQLLLKSLVMCGCAC